MMMEAPTRPRQGQRRHRERMVAAAQQATARGPEPDDPHAQWYGYPGPAWPAASDEPMRVLVHLRTAHAEGMECFADYLARGMAAAAPNCVQWAFAVEEGGVERTGQMLQAHGPVHIMPDEPHHRDWAWLRVVLNWRPHLVHTSHYTGAWRARRYGLPCLATVHGVPTAIHQAYGAGVADRAVGVSEAVRGIPTIPNGIIAPPWPAQRRLGEVVVLGRLDADRSPELALDALAMAPGARMRFIGEARNRRFALAAEAEKRGVADRVIAAGHLPPEEARALAAGADVIMVPCEDSFGLALAEAIAAGAIPVVVQGAGYQPTLARAGGGFVTTPSASGLAEGLRRALALERGERERERYARVVAATYGHTRMATAYLREYRALQAPVTDVLIVAAGHLATTQECVRHVLANTWWPYRIVLVANGAPEVAEWGQTVAATLPAGRMDVVVSPENIGCGAGRNLGLAHCSGAFVALLDNDMLVPPGWLEPLTRDLLDDPQAAAVGPWWCAYGDPREGDNPRAEPMGCAAALFRRRALSGGFAGATLDAQVGEDTEVNWRLLEAGHTLLRDDRVRWYHLGGPPTMLGMTRAEHMDAANMQAGHARLRERWERPGVRRADTTTETGNGQ